MDAVNDRAGVLPKAITDTRAKVKMLEREAIMTKEAAKEAREALDSELAYLCRLIDEYSEPGLFAPPADDDGPQPGDSIEVTLSAGDGETVTKPVKTNLRSLRRAADAAAKGEFPRAASE